MKRLLIILLLMFSPLILLGQHAYFTNALVIDSLKIEGGTFSRGGLIIGDESVTGTDITIIDSVAFFDSKYAFYHGSDTVAPYTPVADQVVIGDVALLIANNLSDVANAATSLGNLGLTATASEVNTPLDGASVTLTEFRELETIGATTISTNQWAAVGSLPETVTGTEIGYTDGVTSAIQTQLDDTTSVTDVAISGKIVKKTIGTPGDAGMDFTWTGDANSTAQNIDLGAIVPAGARVIHIEMVCTETVTAAGAVDITLRAGNASAGEQFIISLSCDDANEVVGIITPTLPSAVIMNWSATTNIWIGGDPDVNWSTLTAGQWAVYVTYIAYSDI